MAMNDRQRAIMSFCVSPKTLKEMQDHWNVSHMTIRRELTILKELNFIRETGFRKGKEKQYQTVLLNEGANLGAYNLTTKLIDNDRELTDAPVNWLRDRTIENNATKIASIGRFTIARLLAEHALVNHLEVPFAKPGVSLEGTQAILELAMKVLDRTKEFLEQVQNIPAWEGKEYGFTLYGNNEVDWELVGRTLQEFEELVNNSKLMTKIDLEVQSVKLQFD